MVPAVDYNVVQLQVVQTCNSRREPGLPVAPIPEETLKEIATPDSAEVQYCL